MSICLVGSWAKVPNGEDALDMAQNVLLNRDNIAPLPENRDYLHEFRQKHPDVKAALVDGIDMFDDQYFGTGEAETMCMDPQQRMLMQGVILALENAGITMEMASEARISVYTAAWAYDYKDLLPADQYMATGNSASVMCGRITYFLNSRGAAVGIETACSSSLVAFHLARQAILNGETKLALVCGANHVGARSFHSLYNSHMVSPNGRLAAFDRSANGFVRAESFAVAVLCSKQYAEEFGLRVHCECIGSAFNSDGRTPSLTAPNPISQFEVQIEAMGKNINRDSVQLVTCHGTGTKLGDQIELTAIKTSFKSDIRVMSPKSSLGHGEGAAGLIGVLQSLYSMQKGIIPNQLHLQIPSEHLGDQSTLTFVNEEMELNRIGISSYGFGGTNACAIIDRPSIRKTDNLSYAESNVLFLSAKSEESLKLKIGEFGSFMEQTDSALEDILFTENIRKSKYDVRAAVFGRNREEIARKLNSGDFLLSDSREGHFEIEFGEGNEKLWLLRMLYERNETFRAAIEKYCAISETCGFAEARAALFFPFKLTLTPLIYNVARLISSMATFEVLMNYHSVPSRIKGKGMGQIFCLAAARVISFEDAIQMIKNVVADVNLMESLEKIDLENAAVPIIIQSNSKPLKKLTKAQIIAEISKKACNMLMTFTINGKEIQEVEPVRKMEQLLCSLFVNGYDPAVNFRGQIVNTPGYSFLKRRFWPQKSNPIEIQSEETDCVDIDTSEVYNKVKEIVRSFLDFEDDSINLLETGAVDSLTSIEMIEAIGTSVNCTMPFDLLEIYPTILDIVNYLKSLLLTSNSTPKKSISSNQTEDDIIVVSSDFMFAGTTGEKELWDTMMSSKLVTARLSDSRRIQCEGDPGMEAGLLKQDISLFDNSFFSIPKDESEFMDPQHRLLLHSAYNALERSGLDAIPDADLFIAISSHSEYRAIAEKHIPELDERLWMGTVHSMVSGRLASLLGIRGRTILVDTTCSSIASALEMAIQSIHNGKNYAVVATTQLIQSSKWLYSLRTLLDHHFTKSFSVDGSGFCRSDGVGVIILKASKGENEQGILKLNSAVSKHCGTVITPVVGVISQLLQDVGDISYLEGHGTATTAGDSAESLAYQKIENDIIMSSVKAQFGHCEVASGLIQLMKVASLTNHGIIPAIVHNDLPIEHIRNNSKIRLPFVAEECEINKSAIVSFGITGTKTTVTTERLELKHDSPNATCFLFPISAKTKDALKKAIFSFIDMIQNTNQHLFNLSTAMQKQKSKFKWRAAVVARTHDEAVRRFKRCINDDQLMSTDSWYLCTYPQNFGCMSFFENIPEFEGYYTSFANRIRFNPHSDPSSIYHSMAVTYSFLKIIISHKIANCFAVTGFHSLVLLSAIDAAPAHYLNDLIHSFANNDIRMMKRIARDVSIQVDAIQIFDFKGKPISTARDAVLSAFDSEFGSASFPDQTLFLSSEEISTRNMTAIQTIFDYYEFVAQKYVNGASLDFNKIFGSTCKNIELPEYPFNRKSFWLPIGANSVQEKKNSEPILSHEFHLASEKWKHVRNHVIESQIVLPGATSLRIVYELNGSNPITLTNVDFLNKITPKEAIPMIIKQRSSENQQILSFGENDAISYGITDHVESTISPISIPEMETNLKYMDEIYQRFSANQLTYRNEFQMINSVRCITGRGEINFSEIQHLDVLIDGALQSIVLCSLFENATDLSPVVPFSIEEITIQSSDLSNTRLRANVEYESSESFISGSATVLNESGNIILHIKNVSFKRLYSQSVKTVRTMSSTKSLKENEQAKREARSMLHIWFEDNFGWTDIDDTTGFFDLGLSSIQAVKLRNSIKSNYPEASSTCVFDYPSIQELSSYLSTLGNQDESENDDETIKNEDEDIEETRLSQNPIGVMSAACRLPGGITCPAELWELLKIGKNASSRIPANRIPSRNTLILGAKYGNPVEGGNFINQDISQFDPAFFKISKSEAEFIDPQQRILLECVQECLENSGVTDTSDVGVFVGLMEKEYQDMVESSSILAMLGSMAAVIAGRINYVFGCHGPSVTIDTACSSSLVALEMGVNALLDNRCSRVIVAGVNLILNEKGQGLRTNGKMLSQHGMCLSFDSRASGYGRSDGCVVLMLEKAKSQFHYMSTIQAVNVNHGGRSVSLTAPNGVAHKMLLSNVLRQSPSLAVDYWEAHGTGTPLGDPIEFNTLSSIFQNIIIGSVKASLGHGEASAGTCGLLKLFMMLSNQYVPSLIHFHVLNKDINAGNIRLPIIGEDTDLVSAGISSFGVSGTNAAAIALNDNNKIEPYNVMHAKYILPLSAKNQASLDQLEKEVIHQIPNTDVPINNLVSAMANHRSHFNIRNALIVSHSGVVIKKSTGKPYRVANKEKYRVKIEESALDPSMLQFDLIKELFTVASLKNPTHFALQYAIVKFLSSISQFVEVVPIDSESLITTLLSDGSLKWDQFNSSNWNLCTSVLNELADLNINSGNNIAMKNYHTQPECRIIKDATDLLDTIVNLYINGYDIEWSNIYPPVQTYVPLPNYQFNRQSLWFEDREEIVDHYLLGTIDTETENSLIFKNMISELRHPQLFQGKPLCVGTIMEIAIEAFKIRALGPFTIQNLNISQINLTKPVWLTTIVEEDPEDHGYIVKAFIDENILFTLNASSIEVSEKENPAVEVSIPENVIHLSDCPNAIIRKKRNMVYIDSRSEVSPFRTANIVLNEIIGFSPTPSDMFLEIFESLGNEYWMVRVDDGALWQFQMISHDKTLLCNLYVLKDAQGLEIPKIRMHKKSTLLSSQEASVIAVKTLQAVIRHKLICACNDVMDSGIEIDESQLSTGFSELGLDSLAIIDLMHRLNQKYFLEIELTTSDLFDNPNIIDLSIKIEELLREKGISQLPSATPTPKTSLRERKISIPAVKHQELAQIEFVENYEKKLKEKQEKEEHEKKNCMNEVDRNEIRRKISSAVLDISAESLSTSDLDTKGFSDLGMDSLSMVDFVNRLNDKYFPGEDINTSDVFDYPTVDELTEHITRKKSIGIIDLPRGIEKDQEEDRNINHLSDAYYLIDTENTNDTEFMFKLTGKENEIYLEAENGKHYILEANKIDDNELQILLKNQINIIFVEFEDVNKTVEEFYLILLDFTKILTKKEISCKFAVSNIFSIGNSIARAFMKSVSSEKYPLLELVWDQKVQPLKLTKITTPVNGSWLITGGLSGIGFEIGKYLANNGAENVVLISRRNPSDQILKEISNWKCKVHTIASDVSDKNKMISEMTRIGIQINGIIHSAGVLKDSKLERQSAESFRQVFKPKADGFSVLEELEKHFSYKIDHFIVMSSFTAACGNEGQLNYGVANSYLEHQVVRRRTEGKSGCAIQWGNWIDTGMATSSAVRKFLADLGFLGQHNDEALMYLRYAIEKQPDIMMVANIDWSRILKNRKDLPRDLIILEPKNFEDLQKRVIRVKSDDTNFEELKLEINDEEDLIDIIKTKLGEITKLKTNRLNVNKNLMDVGLNSHLLTLFLNEINQLLNIDLTMTDVYTYPTIQKLAEHILEMFESSKNKIKDHVNAIPESDFCPIYGINIFFDELEDLEEAKMRAISGIQNDSNFATSGDYVFSVIGKSKDAMISEIKTMTREKVRRSGKSTKSVLMLTGQGSQYPMMGRQLVEHFGEFRNTLEYCLSKCDEYLEREKKLWDILFDTENYEHLQLTKHMQPIMFSFGYAIAKLWESFGVVPDFYLGHSVGELVAGVLAGILSLDDGLRLIVERGKAMENIAGLGALLAVQREIADDVLRNFKVCVATLNSPKQVVFAGTKSELDKALAFVKSKAKQGTFVNQKYPFHSNLIQESHLVNLRKILKNIQFMKASTPLVSNVSGQIIDTFNEEYIVKHTISAVKFVNCVETLEKEGVNVWIDAGPSFVLGTFVKRTISPSVLLKHRIIQTCKEKDQDIEATLNSCLELEQVGAKINWSRVYGCDENQDLGVTEFPLVQQLVIKDDEFEILKGHRLNGRIIIAGAYQLCKMNELINKQQLNVKLKNVKFLKPWYIEDGKEFEVRWNADSTIGLFVNDEAKCSAKVDTTDLNEIQLDLDVANKSGASFDIPKFYDTLYENGLQYDDGFRRIENARRTNEKCTANLKQSQFLWPLLDSAMHSITASVVTKRRGCYFLPIAMESISIKNQNLTHKKFNSIAVITSQNEKFIQVNAVLKYGEEIIGEIRNMTIVVAKNADFKDNDIDRKESDIEIVGFDVIFPYNSSKSESWDFLKIGKLRNTFSNREIALSNPRTAFIDINPHKWDPEFFGIRPSEAAFLDPQQRLLLTSIAKMLDAFNIKHLPSNTGVFIGCSTHEFAHLVYANSSQKPSAEWSGGTACSAMAGRISHWLKLKGPAITVDTACSSSFTALCLACDALKEGKCDYAIVGTINLVMHEMTTNVLENSQMIVADHCKVFDEDANGYKRSEAISTLLITKNAKHGFAKIKNWAIGHNGNSSSLFTPNGNAQSDLINLLKCEDPKIDQIEAHCTGTKLGDPIEVNAILKSYTPNGITISSTKSNVGHCEGSSGLISLCSMLLQKKFGYGIPQLHLKLPNALIRNSSINFRIVGEEFSCNNILINNFGFTGSNCSVRIHMENNPVDRIADADIYFPMFLSSKSPDLLSSQISQLIEFIELSSDSLNSISISLSNKKVYPHKIALIYNFKRKLIWRSDNQTEVASDNLTDVVDYCKCFLKQGVVEKYKDTDQCLIELPLLTFHEKNYWELPLVHDNTESRNNFNHHIFFEKYLLKKRCDLNEKRLKKVWRNSSKLEDSFDYDVILFQPNKFDCNLKTQTDSFMKLINIWKRVDPKSLTIIIVACMNNGTSHTEWTGLLRTLASEQPNNYKFVSYETNEQLEENLTNSDLFEAIFYRDGIRWVERLREMKCSFTNHPKQLQNILMTGGTGGIGKAVLDYTKPKNGIILSRKEINTVKGETHIKHVSTDISNGMNLQISTQFDCIFHFAGTICNSGFQNMEESDINKVLPVKFNGAQNLLKVGSNTSKIVISSSAGSIIGSYGQANYVFSNGLMTSLLETNAEIKHDIFYWGPWRDVGMLSTAECHEVRKQLELTGWKLLTNQEALSVFNLQEDSSTYSRQIIIFKGDFELISKRHNHLKPFLSDLLASEKDTAMESNQVFKKTLYQIFYEVTGIEMDKSKKMIPFMDMGIDSLCMENLRASINEHLGVQLTVSNIFENSSFEKLDRFISCNNSSQKSTKQSEVENLDDGKVAVIGWSAEFSGCRNISEFWNNLLCGKVLAGNTINNTFDNKFFNITDEDAKILDPQIKKFIQHSYLALENSGYIKTRSELKCAVFAGAEPSDYGRAEEQSDSMKKMFIMNMNNFLASYAAYCLDLNGEAVSIYSACSTSLVAISQAIHTLNSGKADLALVGAASIVNQGTTLDGMRDSKKTIFSKTGVCRPFDKDSEGIVRGSGVGCLVLKKLSDAKKDSDNIHFIIKAFEVNNDGNSRASFMAPNPAGQLKCIKRCLERLSDEEKMNIEFVECHATGTALGDSIELASLHSAYSFKPKLRIGSCKANIGHAYAVSGLAAIIKSALILQHRLIPPQVNFEEFRQDYSGFFKIGKSSVEIPQNSLIAIDSFGIGGTNAHMIIESGMKTSDVEVSTKGLFLLPISMKNDVSDINKKLEEFQSYLFNNPHKLSNIHFTMWNSREHHNFRSHLIADNINGKIKISSKPDKLIRKKDGPNKIALFFAPQGLQFHGILKDDMTHNSVFRNIVIKLCDQASKICGVDFLTILYPNDNQSSNIDDIEFSQVAILIQSTAICEYLKNYNIHPEILVGHSVGEYCAATISNSITFESMTKLLYERSKLIAKTTPSKMLMILDQLDIDLPDGIEISSIVDHNIQCVVGNTDDILRFEYELQQKSIRFRRVSSNRGFHSSMMNPISSEFRNLLKDFKFQPSTIPCISSITGEFINNFESIYFEEHLSKPVNLKKTIDTISSSDIEIIIEIGATGILSKLLSNRNSKIEVIPTCGTKQKPIPSLLDCLGKLWQSGVDIKMQCSGVLDQNLPGYCFDETTTKNEELFKLYSNSMVPVRCKDIKSSEFMEYDGSCAELTRNIIIFNQEDRTDHNNFYDLEKFLENQRMDFKKLLVITTSPRPFNYICLGLLRCFQLKTKRTLLFVENFEKLSNETVISQIPYKTTSDYLRINSNGCFESKFSEIPIHRNMFNRGNGAVLIFGANGFIGSLFVKIFERLKYKIVKISYQHSDIKCDITNYDSISNIFKSLDVTNYDYIVNCVGSETSPKLHKSYEEKESVLKLKTFGNQNILNAIDSCKLSVAKYISCSSLSSTIPLLGNEDYAGANCFVESLPSLDVKFPILTLSLPAVRKSRMFENSTNSTKMLLENVSIEPLILEKILERSLPLTGSIFVAPENPQILSQKSIDYHKFQTNFPEKQINEKSIRSIIEFIWRDTLSEEMIINDDSNFFSLGGDSLSALQVVWQIERLTNKSIHVNDVFNHPKLMELCQFVENTSHVTKMVQKQQIDYNNIGLTSSQTQMFMLREIDQSGSYNIVFRIKITKTSDEFNWNAMKCALLSVIAHNHSYRTLFERSLIPKQKILSLTESFYNLASIQIDDAKIESELNHIFNLQESVPLRILISHNSHNGEIVFNQHHILTDGWSMTVLAKAISSFYEIYQNNGELPPKPSKSYEMGSEDISDRVLEIVEKIKIKHTIIPYDFYGKKSSFGHVRKITKIPSKLWEKLISISKENFTTPYNVALTAFALVLKSFTNRTDLLFAYVESGRNSGNADQIGYFINNVLFHCRIDGSQCIKDHLSEISGSLNHSRQNSDIPFHLIVEQRKELGDISIYFNFRQKLDFPNISIPGALCEIEHLSLNNAFDFSFTIDELPTHSTITIDYHASKYQEKTIQKFLNEYQKLLNSSSRENHYSIVKCDYPTSLFQGLQDIEKVENISKLMEKQYQINNGSLLREDDLIGINSDNAIESIIASSFIGVQYAPIDNKWPIQRQKFVEKILQMLYSNPSFCTQSQLRIFPRRSPYGAIYTIFTSGSTGIPKGVVLAETSVCAFLTSATKMCNIRQDLRIANSVNKVFDVSVSNIFGAVVNNSKLVENGAHYQFLTSAVFNSFSRSQFEQLGNLETLTIGGETISWGALQTLLNLKNPPKIFQIYGPTETCIWSLVHQCKTQEDGAIIGKSIENEYSRISNHQIRGELIIGGAAVARGYFTYSEEFGIPFNGIYKTGDVVDKGFRENNMRYIGRIDNETKWKGIRIDLTEVENELISLLQLQQVKTMMIMQKLVAFIVMHEDLSYADIITKLDEQTSKPDHFVQLRKMPLNSSAKINKDVLLQIFNSIRKSYKKERIEMLNSIEEKVLQFISKEVGQTPNILDKFSAIGGNSLTAIRVAHSLSENFKIEIKAHDVLQSRNVKDIVSTIIGLIPKPQSSQPNVITKLRESPNEKFKIYFIHAIGGTIYPYYSFLQIFPKDISLYGIEYDLKYPSTNLRELAQFYANEIAAHAENSRIFVMGHSMGGIMSREIVNELKIFGYEIPFVIMFDSWVLRTNELDIENIKNFIKYVFSGLPDSEQRTDRAIKLAQLLREYKTSISDTKLYLFKSKQLGDAAFKNAVRQDLNDQLSRSMLFNGFDELSLQPMDTYLIDGDHESCLKAENLKKVKELILKPFSPYL